MSQVISLKLPALEAKERGLVVGDVEISLRALNFLLQIILSNTFGLTASLEIMWQSSALDLEFYPLFVNKGLSRDLIFSTDTIQVSSQVSTSSSIECLFSYPFGFSVCKLSYQDKMKYAVETPRLWFETLAQKHAEDYFEIMTGPESIRWAYVTLSVYIDLPNFNIYYQ
jgi:hypothetical protein